MRKGRAATAFLVVALVVLLSALFQGRPTNRTVTGFVAAFESGQWLTLASHATERSGITFALHRTTAYDPPLDTAVIKRGDQVSVSYRSAAERWPLADRVRLLSETKPH